MAVKIRLMRIGAKKRPFYRVVAVDERKKRTGSYIELLGTYNPLTEPHEVILKQDRIDEWIKKGAQPSEGFLRVIGKAPQRPPRKPKKPARNASPARNDAAISSEHSDAGGEKVSQPEVDRPFDEGVSREEEVAEQAPMEGVTEEEPAETEEEKSEGQKDSENQKNQNDSEEPSEKESSDQAGTTEPADTLSNSELTNPSDNTEDTEESSK